ncbi:HlyD family efflux transporter periplasmic adaptor subunit [Anaerolentibacter hominis]|uniref:HlyD family efflux transporter periplasmic adaptor subunit n=1 Tax=Anaerolentibacter hominis TaxID=3079009 RepID=UPI0031B81268
MKKIKAISKKKKILILVIAVVVLGAGGFAGISYIKGSKAAAETTYEEVTVSRSTIVNTISGTGTIEPLNQYNVTSLVSGEILSSDFEEGDEVKEGQVLYQIDTTDAEKNLKSAKLNVEKAQKSYNKALKQRENLKVTANASGVIKKLYVEDGDSIKAGTVIADIYDNSTMLLTIPFNSLDVTSAMVGKKASVQLTDSLETVSGTVSQVSGVEEAADGNMLVKNIVIKVKNPGGITAGQTATASVGSIACNSAGTFEVSTEKSVTAQVEGTVASLSVKEGGNVTKGGTILTLQSDSIEDTIDNAATSLEEAELSLENQSETLDNYTITAPISGTVITKNVKQGDTLDNQNSAGAMAVIYDMSAMTFDMAIDEVDIKSIQTGQTVNVTVDALDGITLTGKVEKVSVSGTTSGGVTSYPVTVRMDEVGELLPGMNVTGEIVTESAENVIAIPVSAVSRGNIVYVKGEAENGAQQEVAGEQDDKGTFRQTPEGFYAAEVTLGITDGTNVEIQSGLSEGDIIYIEVITIPTSKESDGEGSMMMDGGMGGGMPSGGMPSGGMPSGGAPSGGMSGGGPGRN